MGKNVHSRRHSTGNFYLEPSGYEGVLSRYLSGPFPSCHDHCKPSLPPTTSVRRSNKPNVDSLHAIKKQFTHIPKSPTEHGVNISLPKHHAPIEFKAKRQDLKSKSEENDPFYIPPSRITRRYSDVVLPTNDLGDVIETSVGGGLTRNRSIKSIDKKFQSRKDSTPVKSSTVKSPEIGKISKKVQTHNNSTRPEVDRISKKSSHGNHDGKGVQGKTEILDSSKNEERLLENGGRISSKSKRDEKPPSESQSNGSEASFGGSKTEKLTRVGKLAKENEDGLSQKLKFKQGKISDKQCESIGQRKVKFGQGKVLHVNQNCQQDSKSLRRLSSDGGVIHSTESNSENVVLKSCETQVNKHHLQGNNVIEETASKLIKTRKSKVQALVGAFEMISTSGF